MRYLGVSRAEFYSPNRVTGDGAVFLSVCSAIERQGHSVIRISESELVKSGLPAGIDGIFQMARSREALALLETAAVPVTNTVKAVRNCDRAAQTRILLDTGLIPDSIVCPTTAVPAGWNCYPCWVKRADSHAVRQDDVQFVGSAAECAAAIQGLAGRGIGECVIQNHVKGWLVKFYGIKGYGLIDCHAATLKESKFGQEQYNDHPNLASVDLDALTAVAERASGILGVDIYGGDAVVGQDGKITIIDFNDWPSFRTCTQGAALRIAELIMSKKR